MSRAFDLPGRSPVMATGAAAATSHPLATATAINILREGGNAIDAAIAASATLCAVEPHMTGIGGDCFAIICEPDGSVHGLNGSGRAPAAAHADWFSDNGISEIDEHSPHSVTVPGALAGWQALHERFGSVDWARLFADAIGYANDGFAVAPRVAYDWLELADKLAADKGAARHLLFDGKTPGAGQRIALPALGGTLAKIAKEGARIFYEGEIAAEIAATVQDRGGLLTEEDLAACQADWVTPISTKYRGLDILEIPPNGQGVTALILLNLLAASEDSGAPDSAQRFHRLIELGRIAYAMRDAHVGDPETMVTSIDSLLAGQTTQALLQNFDPGKRNPDIELPPITGSDTVYLTVVDSERRAVSFINSVFTGFGSGIVTSNTGIALQSRGAGFCLEPGHPNCIGPSKRPLHTIIPAMAMKDGKPALSFGVMGGAYQPMGHAHVLQNMLEFGMDPQRALDFPRAFWDDDGTIEAESGLPEATVEGLRALGHMVGAGEPHGGGQIIAIDHEAGVLTAGSDPRKDGHAAGF